MSEEIKGIYGYVTGNQRLFTPLNQQDPYRYFAKQDIIKQSTGKPGGSSNALGYLGAGLQGLQAGMSNYNAIDDTALDNQIASAENVQFNAGSNNTLLSQWNNYNPLDTDYKMSDVGFDWKEQLGNTLSATATGALSGSWVGAAIGLAGGLAGNIASGVKANRAIKDAEEEAERMNTLNQNKFLAKVDELDQQNDLMMKRNIIANGGSLMAGNEDLTFINNGGTHEQNPLGGVPAGIAPDGSQNLVEEGEVIYKGYVFSNRLKVPKRLKDKYKLNEESITFAEAVKQLLKPYEETLEDPITKKAIEALMSDFISSQEELRMKKQIKQNKDNTFDWGGWKYAPMVANAASLLQNIFTPADYTYANKIENAPTKTTVSRPTLLSNRYRYKPTDINYLANKSLAQAAATRASLLDTANNAGAARANLLAADYNAQDAWANTLLKAAEAEEARRLQAEQFNLGVDQFNAQILNNAAQMDAQLAEAFNQRQLTSLAQAAQLRSAEDQARARAIGANTTALADNLYKLYVDNWNAERADKAIETGDYAAAAHFGLGKNGGKLKRKKGLTY